LKRSRSSGSSRYGKTAWRGTSRKAASSPCAVRELVDTTALHDALLEQELGYPQTNGTAELRETIAGMYPGATPDHVQVTNGGSKPTACC
jgi:hypothetical protein